MLAGRSLDLGRDEKESRSRLISDVRVQLVCCVRLCALFVLLPIARLSKIR